MKTSEMILAATNGGLDIIHDLIPNSKNAEEKSSGNPARKFNIREKEKNPSAILDFRDGVWVVIDLGNDTIPRNAINLHSYLNNKSFEDSIKELSEKYLVKKSEQIPLESSIQKNLNFKI